MDPREQLSTGRAASTDAEATRGPRPELAFAHASEAEFARILDFYQVAWEYEPQVFPILWDLDGNVLESFAPDFFLPDLELFVELTTLQQRLVRKKNRKVRRLRELYPGSPDQALLRPRLPGPDAQVRPLGARLGAQRHARPGDAAPGRRRLAASREGAPGAGPDRAADFDYRSRSAAADPDGSRTTHERRSRGARRRAVRRAAAAHAHDSPAT